MLNRFIIILSAFVLSLFVPFEMVEAQNNVFQKGVTAVKNFFKGNKNEKEKQDIVPDSVDTVVKKGRKSGRKPLNVDYTLEQLYELSLDENLSVPVLPDNEKSIIKPHQLVQAKKLVVAGLNVETMRKGEVVIATIQSDELFYPNDTVLKPNAGKQLRPFLQFLKVPDMYRMLLAMHSDDTGTSAYTDALTSKRVIAVLEWFIENSSNSDYIIPYAMGASEPLYLNNSIANRQLNRRLEIYLVPGKTMIDAASSGQLVD